MQGMNNSDFDNIVKTILSDATEEVPSGAWHGVQNGLKAARARSAGVVAFRRVVYTAASVAAAAALIFSAGLFRHNSIQPTISEKAITLVPEPAEESVSAPDSGRDALQPVPTGGTRPRSLVSSPANFEDATAPVAVGEAEVTANPVMIADALESPATEAAAEESPAVFVQEDFIPEVRRTNVRRPRLTFGGLLGNNGARTSPYTPPIRRSQLNVQDRNVIRENGESSYGFPISLGVGVAFPVGSRISIGTGLNYTSLSRTFSGKYLAYEEATGVSEMLYGDASHTVRYLGIPLNLYCSLPSAGRFRFYTHFGGEVERSIFNQFKINTNRGTISRKVSNKGQQFSLGAGVGAEFMLTDHLGLYVDPALRYYFDCNQPKSMRTQHPWMFTIEAGFRFSL